MKDESQPTQIASIPEKQQMPIDAIITMANSELGFSQVIETISRSQKPLIGHNMIYDVAFIYN